MLKFTNNCHRIYFEVILRYKCQIEQRVAGHKTNFHMEFIISPINFTLEFMGALEFLN